MRKIFHTKNLSCRFQNQWIELYTPTIDSRHVEKLEERKLEQVRSLLKTYQDKYPTGGFDFLSRLGE
jgi:hypothetical protein